jgi:hypothetical protein
VMRRSASTRLSGEPDAIALSTSEIKELWLCDTQHRSEMGGPGGPGTTISGNGCDPVK